MGTILNTQRSHARILTGKMVGTHPFAAKFAAKGHHRACSSPRALPSTSMSPVAHHRRGGPRSHRTRTTDPGDARPRGTRPTAERMRLAARPTRTTCPFGERVLGATEPTVAQTLRTAHRAGPRPASHEKGGSTSERHRRAGRAPANTAISHGRLVNARDRNCPPCRPHQRCRRD